MSAPRVTDVYLENTESGISLGSIRTSGLLKHTVFPRRQATIGQKIYSTIFMSETVTVQLDTAPVFKSYT